MITHYSKKMSLVDENCIVKVVARALSKVANYSSMAFRSNLTLLICSTELRIPANILAFMNIMERRLDLTHFSLSVIASIRLVLVMELGSSFLIARQYLSILNVEKASSYIPYSYHP